MIIIIDYNMGNLGSIQNMLKKIGAPARISSSPEDILAAEKLILPGVGSFDHGMASLAGRGLLEPLNEVVCRRGRPILGICLGMQLLARRSEEGQAPGLGWIDADVIRFDLAGSGLRVPHMGWNQVRQQQPCPLFDGMEAQTRYYFVHSYHVSCRNRDDVVTTTAHGLEFVSSFRHGNIFGVQFHPEKSHKFGMRLLQNFQNMVLHA